MPHATLTVQTLLYARELASGDFAVAPVVDPTLASFGSEASCLAEQRLFLTEYLARAAPEIVARFALPEGVTLREVDVLVPREGLPRRLQIDAPLRIAGIVIPAERGAGSSGERDGAPLRSRAGAWIVVPAIDHTFFVRSEDDVDEALRAEVSRMAGALDLSAWQYLQLFPPRAHALVPVEIEVERMDRAPMGRTAARRALVDAERRRWAIEVLESVATPLDPGDAPPLVGRDAEVRQLAALVRAQERSAVLVTGGHLEGKTALVRAAVRGAGGGEPLRVYATSGSQLIAGMSGLGQWQERVRRVMEAAEVLDATLYFESIADLLGDHAGGGVDLPAAMKPWLEEGRVRIVGELRNDLLEAAERRHFGFLAFFTRVRLAPLDAARTIEALRGRLVFEARREPDLPRLRDDAVLPLVDLAERYLPYQSFPGKVMRLYDELRAMEHDVAGAAGETRMLDVDRVYELFSVRSGVPSFLLRQDRALELADVIEHLGRRVIGQDEAVKRVAETVCVVKAQLQPTGKPLATFLFVGPTGVGKTELARALAAFLFGSAERMVRFDMSEYADAGAAERLIRGTDRADGLLTRRVRDQPFGIVLLDEIEKAHPAVLDLLLQVCGEGRLTDARGRTAYFHDTIVVLTSNLGATSQRASVGFGGESATSPDAARAHYAREVERSFRPELVNRLDRIVTFFPLSRATIASVTRIAIDRLRSRRGVLEGRLRLEPSDAAAATLAAAGYSEAYGARALRRAVEDELVTPMARLLSGLGDTARGASVRVRAADEPRDRGEAAATIDTETLSVAVHRAKAATRDRDAIDLHAVAEIRRDVDRAMRLDRVGQLEEQIAQLVTQLGYGKRRDGDRRTAHEVSTLQAEHHRLAQIWRRLAGAQADAHAAEEVALMAMREGEAIDAFASEARDVRSRFRRELVIALLALEPQRDRVTLLIEDHAAGLGLGLWLAPLLRDLERRGWHASLHAHGASRDATSSEWPTSRKWGPPRDPTWMLERIADAATAPRNVLLRCEGAHAGVLLALEGGLHTFIRPIPDVDKAFVTVRRIAMRTALLDKEWGSAALVPDSPADANVLRRVPAVRTLDVPARTLSIAAGARALDDCGVDDYFPRLEEIALLHLLHVEQSDLDRDELFLGPLDNDY